MKNQLICICGPTASGKTALSIALAKKLHTEIISADSMQVYQRMDIGTAKPTDAERQSVPHHLIDVCSPQESFSVARYVALADAAAQDILSRGMIPVVSGGTGLYMNALIECSTFSGDETDLSVRQKYQQMADEQGNEAVHACLAKVDPDSALQLHPNNLKRVIRALEVYEQTGMTIGALNQMHKREAPKYQAIMIGVCPADRQQLYQRIDLRVDQMMENGLLDETRFLWQNGYLAGTAGQAIGYKELLGYLQGETTLQESVDLLKRRSRNYAKRQLTWLKKDDRIHWIYYNKKSDLISVLQDSTSFLQKFGVQ